ncbi:MAG TPA: tetratricopeptide repeat protein [Burkholderiales bacterium]|nr:tetratricopeptide repeat protein [Burkholderiales bacterium]
MLRAVKRLLSAWFESPAEGAGKPETGRPSPEGEARPDSRALFQAGVLHFRAGKYPEAASCFEQVVALEHDHAEAHLNLGIACQRLGRREDAADSFAMALHHRPEYAEAHFNLGVIELEEGEHESAAARFEEAVRLKPEYVEALSNLGYVQFKHLNRSADGERNLRRAVQLQPRFAIARLNLGLLLQDRGRLDDALAAYEEALRRAPDLAEARLNRALIWLARGDFARGWPQYESRKMGSTHFTPRPFSYPEWNGKSAPGRAVLVYGEQGLGDEIMFASCLPDLMARTGRCVIECSPKLVRLFGRSFPRAVVHGSRQTDTDLAWLDLVGPVDFQIAIGSLPQYFRRSRADFPDHAGYLAADDRRIAYWRERLSRLGPGLKVGISWRGGTAQTRLSLRSLAIEQCLPLLKLGGARFVSLQYTDCRDELARLRAAHGVNVEHWQDALDDYDETAALVAALDLVISVQTAVAHLTGALGRPVWVMVPAAPEWRYLAAGERMPWYPSARLFRQAQVGEWQPVVDRLAQELGKLLAA